MPDELDKSVGFRRYALGMLALGGGTPIANAASAVAHVWSRARVASALTAVALLCLVVALFVTAARVDIAPSQAWPAVSQLVFAVGLAGVSVLGLIVIAARPGHRVGWLMVVCGTLGSVDLALFAVVLLAYVKDWFASDTIRWIAWCDSWMFLLGGPLLAAYGGLMFPDGYFRSGAWRTFSILLGLAYVVLAFSGATDPTGVDGFANPMAIHGSLGHAMTKMSYWGGWTIVAGALAAVICLVTRFRAAAPEERRPIRRAIIAAIVQWITLTLCVGVLRTLGGPTPPEWPIPIALLALAYVFAVGVLRDRLYEVDLLVNRILVYFGLTAVIVAVYAAILAAAGALLQNRLVTSGLAVIALALLALPLRRALQTHVDALMYGRSADRFEAVSRLGERLGTTRSQDEMLAAVASEVTVSLGVPYAAIELEEADGRQIAGEHGDHGHAELARVPLSFDGRQLGSLLVAPRAPGEPFRDVDVALLNELARQTAITVKATELSRELQLSREKIVTAREEERRRLRRDLHDGFGPQLAGVVMQLEAAENLAASDPNRAAGLIGRARDETRTAVTGIRRLVYGLRPPTLDERGLVEAVREQASRLAVDGGSQSLWIGVDTGDLPQLTAACEVAAYRIVVEAMSNVVRHANASRCWVRFSAAGTLDISVEDDGAGLPEAFSAGVGVTSMRERAAELGGTCRVDASPAGGTRVRATLPLAP